MRHDKGRKVTVRMFSIRLKTKILALVVILIVFVVATLTTIFAIMEGKEAQRQVEQLALQTAKTVSLMPAVAESLVRKDQSQLQYIASHVREQVDAASVIITDRHNRIFSHPHIEAIGQSLKGENHWKALVFGGYYSTSATGRLGEAIRGKAPIFIEENGYRRLIGVVTVEFLQKEIRAEIMNQIAKMSFISLLVLLPGIAGSLFLARNIKKDTLGLEPSEIAELYRMREATLYSVKEGIVAIDEKGRLSTMNASAERLIGLSASDLGQPIDQVLPETKLLRVLQSGKAEYDEEMMLNDRLLIVNRIPVFENGRLVGAVSSFRDKTEIENLTNTLSEVREYSENLRAQTHEFTNMLYVLSGLLQLGKIEEAVSMIHQETEKHQNQNRILFEQIDDPKVQAILIGKIGKASEKKIQFHIDQESSLQTLPSFMETMQLATILGNLIDNAFEAVQEKKEEERLVTFFTTDLGEDIIFEVCDNGDGIAESDMKHLFDLGFSTKQKGDRGYGLTNVKKTVRDLNGSIVVENRPEGGAIFTIFLPKKAG